MDRVHPPAVGGGVGGGDRPARAYPKLPPPLGSRVAVVLIGVTHSGSRKEVVKRIGTREFGHSSLSPRIPKSPGPPARAARRAPGIAAISIRARNLNRSFRGFGPRYGNRGIQFGSIRARGAPRPPGGVNPRIPRALKEGGPNSRVPIHSVSVLRVPLCLCPSERNPTRLLGGGILWTLSCSCVVVFGRPL